MFAQPHARLLNCKIASSPHGIQEAPCSFRALGAFLFTCCNGNEDPFHRASRNDTLFLAFVLFRLFYSRYRGPWQSLSFS